MAKARSVAKTKQNIRSTGEVDVAIGLAIRSRRLAQSISQEKLAADIGVTFQQIQKYEKGSNRVAAPTLMRIADALRCTPSELLPPTGRTRPVESVREAAYMLELTSVAANLNAQGRTALLKVAKSFLRDPDYLGKKLD